MPGKFSTLIDTTEQQDHTAKVIKPTSLLTLSHSKNSEGLGSEPERHKNINLGNAL